MDVTVIGIETEEEVDVEDADESPSKLELRMSVVEAVVVSAE